MRLKRGSKDWDRFWSKVNKGPKCWEWQACCTTYGYGVIWWGKTHKLAHRVVYEMGHGTIPQGMHICHKCDNPPCVRPSHLFLGTPKDNHQDSYRKGRRAVGAMLPQSKLTEKDVKEILIDTRKYIDIGKSYNINPGTVSSIKYKIRWKHIKEKGVCSGVSKLTEPQVKEIRKLNKTQKEIAKEYGVSRATIWQIKNRITWKHVK